MKSWEKLLSTLVCLFFLTGCISFRGRELPQYDFSNFNLVEPNLSISYSAKVIRTRYATPFKEKTLDVFQSEINQIIKGSGLFSHIETDEGMADIHLDLTLYHWNNATSSLSLVAQYYGLLSALSFGILPYYSQEYFLLRADIFSEGQVIRKYEFKHSTYDVIQILGIITLPFNDRQGVIRRALDDLVLNLLYALQQDNLLVGSS